MTNTQLYFAIGLPCFTIATSLIVSLAGFLGIRDAVRETREDIREIRADIKNIMGKLGSMDVELGKLMDKAK